MRIAVIGGGPAGSFFAINFFRRLGEFAFDHQITIFDSKQFIRPGPLGCNMCAGVLSASLIRRLREISIEIPQNLIQSKIDGYILHIENQDIVLEKPSGEGEIYTVFRGNGPRNYFRTDSVSFDDYLLQICRTLGVTIVPETVDAIERRGNIYRLHLPGEREIFEADFVVIAGGVNTRFLTQVEQLGFGYRIPDSVRAIQAELKAEVNHRPNYIHTFYNARGKINFITFTPKKEYITATFVGRKDLKLRDMEAFLEHEKYRRIVGFHSPVKNYCYCHPLLNIASSGNFVGESIVVIGDASATKYYKNGIESAFITASLAVEAFSIGRSKEILRRHYQKPVEKTIPRDNFYGKLLFRFYDFIFSLHFPVRVIVRLMSKEKDKKVKNRLLEIIWFTFTGGRSYFEIFKKWLNLKLQFVLTKHTVAELMFPSPNVKNLGPLQNGSVVAIVGGGPSGTGCALALLKLADEKGIKLKIILFEGKIFERSTHYNQCVGVLSPPIIDLLKEKLEVEFPHHLQQRVIEGYVLHGDRKSVLLKDTHSVSIALRRVNFDEFLLKTAENRGAQIIRSRVTNIELHPECVRIYSESGNVKADVVVGAFGLDDGACKIFERDTSYRQPRFLDSIVTKIHPGMDFMDNFGNYIHAFLPPIKEIEFGGITPKKNHLTINIAGSNINTNHMEEFLELEEVRKVLPPKRLWDKSELDYFKGRFPISVAKGLSSNRFVTVGDAAGMMRPFKGKGVNSGVLTGTRAAEVMMKFGVSQEAFNNYYRMCSDIVDDLPYGRIMRLVTIKLANFKLIDSIIEMGETNEYIAKILFDCVSAKESLKNIYHFYRKNRRHLTFPASHPALSALPVAFYQFYKVFARRISPPFSKDP
jgi:flavin-dependent dehydrogenase